MREMEVSDSTVSSVMGVLHSVTVHLAACSSVWGVTEVSDSTVSSSIMSILQFVLDSCYQAITLATGIGWHLLVPELSVLCILFVFDIVSLTVSVSLLPFCIHTLFCS